MKNPLKLFPPHFPSSREEKIIKIKIMRTFELNLIKLIEFITTLQLIEE